MINTLTIVAIVISSLAVLITLAKISHQLDRIIGLFKTTDKKLSVGKEKEELSSSQIQRQLHGLKKEIDTMKGNVHWKG